jgi:hypothetical protein
MDVDGFWALIEEARAGTAGTEPADPELAEAVVKRATELLAARPEADIIAAAQAFWELMAGSYQGDLWGAAYLINGGCSDDGFDYFRGWLIAQGRDAYRRAVADPDTLAELPALRAAAGAGWDIECESALGIGYQAHLTATGRELPPGSFTIHYPDIEFGWDFDDHVEAAHRLPRLVALYGG